MIYMVSVTAKDPDGDLIGCEDYERGLKRAIALGKRMCKQLGNDKFSIVRFKDERNESLGYWDADGNKQRN